MLNHTEYQQLEKAFNNPLLVDSTQINGIKFIRLDDTLMVIKLFTEKNNR